MDELDLGPIAVARTRFQEIKDVLVERLDRSDKTVVAFCNSHTASLAFADPFYAEQLDGMLLLNDGVAMNLASRILVGSPFPENLNGTDFVPAFLTALERPVSIFLLGSSSDVLVQAIARWSARFPQHTFCGSHHGFFEPERNPGVIQLINSASPDILLVGMGNPRQEQFLAAHAEELAFKLAFGVGALFDFTAGRVRRAPKIAQTLRVEWAVRLMQEPKRLAYRYTIEAFYFFWMVLRIKPKARLR